MSVAPVLVYNRIDLNRRNTRMVLAAFAALLVPFEYCAAVVGPFAYDFTIRSIAVVLAHGSHRTISVTYQHSVGSEVVSLTMVLLALISAVGFAYAGDVFISSFLLWRADARRAHRDREPDLFRTVENLCIGAGLPPPALYIVESTEPNAFTTGCDPRHASLVISRGLLQLLNERELAAVVAHELSHIGNHDTDCSTMIAALVEIVTFPARVVTAIVTAMEERKDGTRSRAQGYVLFLMIVMVVGSTYKGLFTAVLTSEWNLRAILAIAPPIYVFFIAPGCATLLRRTMSQQLDFLADADAALLTRDPEGLALALAKVGGALHFTPNADAATAQLYFVDPLPRRSWWERAYPSHAPIDARIALLARMGDGIPATELRAATAAGVAFRQDTPLVEAAPRPTSPFIVGRPAATDEPVPETPFLLPGTQFRLTGKVTPLYAKPDGWSDVVQQLTSGTTVTFYELVGNFARVATERTAGYISSSTHAVRTDTA